MSRSHALSSRPSRATTHSEYDDDDDPLSDHRSVSSARSRAPFSSASQPPPPAYSRLVYSHPPPHNQYLFPASNMSSPLPSRPNSPIPLGYSSGPSSPTASDTDSDPDAPILPRRSPWSRQVRPRWWSLGQSSVRRRRRDTVWGWRTLKRTWRIIARHPCCPKHPLTIILSLLFLGILALTITLTLMYVLNPDKEALPWRAYCSVPVSSYDPPPPNAPVSSPDIFTVGAAPPFPPFPPENFDLLPPAGVFVGVFSVDSSVERRMMIRTTWANHPRSRNGAGAGDSGDGTSRTIVRFVLGQPRKSWDRRIRLEMEQYNDIIILPIPENMNSGKSHTFFSWAAAMAWVPPVYDNFAVPSRYSYSNITNPAPILADHDPVRARHDAMSDMPKEWVRPDFVIKADDDSFIMLAELEARLRVTLHPESHANGTSSLADQDVHIANMHRRDEPIAAWGVDTGLNAPRLDGHLPRPSDPLVYWGYLVKQRFMAGELYGLSWSLVTWAATDPIVKQNLRGAEDKQTSKWMRLHLRAADIRWVNERCWIYDHPRGGTVYSHGFLFPSEVSRVRRGMLSFFGKDQEGDVSAAAALPPSTSNNNALSIPTQWSYSTVETFGTRYSPPLPDLTPAQSIEALVEGSEMSLLHEGSILTWSFISSRRTCGIWRPRSRSSTETRRRTSRASAGTDANRDANGPRIVRGVFSLFSGFRWSICRIGTVSLSLACSIPLSLHISRTLHCNCPRNTYRPPVCPPDECCLPPSLSHTLSISHESRSTPHRTN
ncbi:hypothetical protein OF83DRAFT_1254585 [Amylostereum chailletii]|nr:hypothetical protein OF83DRAFT_1254585 [Amylostereum chailletii]